MNKIKLSGFAAVCALVVLGAACGRPSTSVNNQMNHEGMNHNGMNHNSMPANSNMPVDHNSMSHAEMKSDPQAAAAPFDLQFIDTMMHHHEGAVAMAETALKNSGNADLKQFAQQIIDAQKKENAQMKQWREAWFAGKPPAKNADLPGMQESMRRMSADADKFKASGGKEFDLLFLSLMIPHHEGAVLMAKDALQRAEHAELKTLAAQIIKAQEAEIKMMNEWKTGWSK